ncbi:hypothetical protein [Natronobeatus ordinarius]|uniref:hypothetical protein n=1 Tax=Natronobeatus ordinarius TaxID=2963433 RepID=UPI0020CF8A2D|nr:hypothetical protein [Natronobeatus ordinarius]
MRVEGTEEDPILFTGTEETRGWWDGIYVQTVDLNNVLSHAVIEYAGNDLDGGLEIATKTGAAADDAELELSNCTIRESAGHGLVLGRNATLFDGSGENTYTDNDDSPVWTRSSRIHMLSDTSSYTGNGDEYVFVEARDGEDISDSRTEEDAISWDAIEVPYRMDGHTEIHDVELTVDPGAYFEFTQDSMLEFQEESAVIMRGVIDGGDGRDEQVEEITFTGTEETRGWWNGLYIQTTAADNVLEHVIVEYGGATDEDSANVRVATRTGSAGGSGELELTGCTLRESDGHGLVLGRDAELRDESRANTYTANTSGPVKARSDNVHTLDWSSDFTGNDDDTVLVEGKTRETDGDVYWADLGVPYRLDGGTSSFEMNGEFEIAPGTDVEFEQEARLRIGDDNAETDIRFVGTEDDPITFTATEAGRDAGIRGWWDGINVRSTSMLNQIHHATIEYGGRDLEGNVDVATGATHDGALDLRDCTIRESGAAGVAVGGNEEINGDVCAVNEFENNDGVDCDV